MTINDLLDAARRRIDRVEPREAAAAVRKGAVLVDIRSERDRDRDGVIPGALFLPRNVLEWRVDPASGHSAPGLGAALDRRIILIGYRGVGLPDVPFDERRGTIANEGGRVAGEPRAYCAGWIKLGGIPASPIRS